jgi:cholesterol transport system auxiliary component
MRPMPVLAVVLTALVGLAAAGCIHVGPAAPAPVDLYGLTPLAAAVSAPAPPGSPRVLTVGEPGAPGALAGDRLAARPDPHRLQYLAGARWIEPLPRMVQRLLVESLAASGRFTAVGRREAGLAADIRLATDLLAFEAVLPEGEEGASVVIRLSAVVLSEPRGKVLAVRTFEAEVPAAGRTRSALVIAFDEAFHRVAAELVAWVGEGHLTAS